MQFKWHDQASLRQLAEEAIVGVSLRQPTERRERLLYDLLVHKTELEMQNEALSEAQVELQGMHERYKALFEKAPIAYVALDPGCRITAANARAAQLLGKPPDDLVGERLNSYLLPDEAIPFERYRREIRRTSASLTAEFTMVVAGGEQREIRVESLSIGGPNPEWWVALTDVTEHNDLLRKLDHAERLEAVQRRASTIAHSLHNLLFGILGHTEVALHFVEPDAPAHAPLLHLREVVKRCSAATEQLTAFSRSESDHPVIVDLHAAVSEMTSILPSLLGEDIELELRLEAPDATVRLSAEHIEQIVLTAARNARQAMPHGGSFRIETANVELAGSAKTTHGVVGTRFLRWTLSDTGIGMTDSTRNRAFEPFFTTKPPGVGTGLGLSMVKAAVERSGGFVALESELGRGTHLVIHLPRATGTSYSPPGPGEITDGEEPFAHVLLVNDDVEVASEVASRLRAEGCEVRTASGSDALDLLRRRDLPVAVLVVDQNYPDFVVSELIRVARETAPWLEIVVAPLELSTIGSTDDGGGSIDAAVKCVMAAAVRASAQ